jgi:murein DD-endopeptidase MepM/ murein hydrolase activator NlpD
VRVVDGGGTPLAGACFQAYADAGGGARGEYRGATCDGDDGAADGVAVLRLPAGAAVLGQVVAPPGFVPAADVSVEVVADAVTEVTVVNAAAGSPVPAGSPAAECPALGPEWADVLRWQPDVLAAQQQVYEDMEERGLGPVLVPVNVVLAVIMIETQGIMPEGSGPGGAVGLLNITPIAIGADRYDFDRAATDPAYSISIGTYELALRYLDSGKLPWRNVVVGYFSGHYEPTGASDAYASDYEYQARFDEYFAELEACAAGVSGTPVAGAGVPGNWLAGVGQPIDGLAYLWGNADATLVQEFGPTTESAAHPEWYTYALEYGLLEPGHTGLDIGVPRGTALYAPSEAVVVCAGTGSSNGEDGCAAFASATGGPTSGRLQLRLPSGDMLIYGHVDDSVVAPGEHVAPGQLVGHSGGPTTGGDWIHLEYRVPDPTTNAGWRIIDPRLTPLNGLAVSPQPAPEPSVTPTPEGGSILVYLRDRDNREVGGGCVELRGNARFAACDDAEGDAAPRPGIVRFHGVPFGGYVVVVSTAPPGFAQPPNKTTTLTPDSPTRRVAFRLAPSGTPPPATETPPEKTTLADAPARDRW